MKNIEYKKNIVLKLNNLLNNIESFILIDSIFLRSNDLIYIRKKIINEKINLFMIKNSLFKKSIINTKFSIVKDYIKGSNIILYFSNSEIINILKKINIFFKNKKINNIKLVFIENKIFNNSNINYLYNLLSYNDSIKKIVFILRNMFVINLIKIFNIIKNIKNKEENKCQ